MGKIEPVIKRIADVGLKVHLQLLSNDEGVDGFSWREGELKDLRHEMDEMLDKYPQTLISSKYYHEIITTGKMMGRSFGWNECPSVTESLDDRETTAPPFNQFFPLGLRFKNSSSLLHIGNARLLHL